MVKKLHFSKIDKEKCHTRFYESNRTGSTFCEESVSNLEIAMIEVLVRKFAAIYIAGNTYSHRQHRGICQKHTGNAHAQAQ